MRQIAAVLAAVLVTCLARATAQAQPDTADAGPPAAPDVIDAGPPPVPDLIDAGPPPEPDAAPVEESPPPPEVSGPGMGPPEAAPLPPAGPPPGPPPTYLPPWFAELGASELTWPGGHLGYDLNNVRGLWNARVGHPMDRGLHFGFGPDDRFLFIANISLAIRYQDVHDRFFTEPRGRSFSLERLILSFRGNFMSPRIVYFVNFLALTALGSSPFLLDAWWGFAIIPRKLSLIVGQASSNALPQGTTTISNQQLAERTLATRFFFVDRSIGAAFILNPIPGMSIQTGVWNHTFEQNPVAFNQYNPDQKFMYTLGIDQDWGGNYGLREGDFDDSQVPIIRASARGLLSMADQPRAPGAVGLKGHILFGLAQLAGKYRGGSLMVAGMARRSTFIDLDPDFLDFGTHVQGGYFVQKRFLEVVGRYSQIWPDVLFDDGRPRNLPERSELQPKADVFEPLVPPSRWEVGGGMRLFPMQDPMFNFTGVYLLRDVDSAFMLTAAGWI